MTTKIREEIELSFRDYKGTEILAKDSGNELGSTSDFLIDPIRMQLAAVVISEKESSKKGVIPLNEIQKWTGNTIWVNTEKSIQKMDELTDLKKWRSVMKQILALDVLSAKKERLGELMDIHIDANGHITGFDVIRGPKWVVGRSLGKENETDKPDLEVGQQLGKKVMTDKPDLEVGQQLDKEIKNEKPDLEVGQQLGDNQETIRIPASATISLDEKALVIKGDYMAQ